MKKQIVLRKLGWLWLVLAMFALAVEGHAQRQMEKLGRGVVALSVNNSTVYVGWRMLATDPADIGFDVYRVTSGVTNLLNGVPITNSCNYQDTTANTGLVNSYFVRPVTNGVEWPGSAS